MKVDEFILELTLKADQFTRATSDAVNSIDKAKDAVVKSSEKIEDAIRKAADGANDSSASIAKALDEISKHTKETAEQTKKFNEEAEKSHKNTANAAKGGTEQLSKMAREALALFGIFATAQGVKGFVQDITESDAALGRFAANLGVAPQAVSAWGTAVGRMGGSAEATQASVQGLYDKLWRMQQLGEEMPKEYWLLGSHGHVELDRTKDIYSQILDLAKAVQNIDRTDGRTNAVEWGRFAGLSVDMINVILAHKNDLKEYLADQEKLGPTPEQISSFQRLQDAWVLAEKKAVSFGRAIVSDVTPSLVGLATAVGTVFDKLKDLDTFLHKRPDITNAAIGVGGAASTSTAAAGLAIASWVPAWLGWTEKEVSSPENSAPSVTANPGSTDNSKPTNASVAGQTAVSGASSVTDNSKPTNASVAGQTAVSGSTSAGMLSTPSSPKEVAIQRFEAMGLSRDAAIGAATGLQGESGESISPSSVNQLSGAYGIANWLGQRKRNFAARFGHSIEQSKEEEQWQFLEMELRGLGGDSQTARAFNLLRSPNISAADATKIWEDMVERHGNSAYTAKLMRKSQSYSVDGDAESTASSQHAATKKFENPAVVNGRIFANPAAYQGYSGAGLSAMMNQTSNVSNSSAETHFNGPIHITLPNVTNAKEFAGGLQAVTVDWGSANFNQGVQ